MAHSPYSPPRAAVSDPPEPQHLFSKPKQVRVAVALLWLSVALDFPQLYVEYAAASADAATFVIVTFAVIFSINAFLNLKISRGRNWARWALLVFTVIGTALYFLPDAGGREASALESSISVVSLVLVVAALYLIFSSPGSLWFRSRA